jgi:Holliday junction resolvase
MSINSRTKGAVGEREAAELLTKHGWEARRGQQFAGSPDSPDVVSNFPWHLEVKRVQASSPMKWMEKATEDSGGKKPPCVLWRPNRKPWIVMMWADDFLNQTENNKQNAKMETNEITLTKEQYTESLKQAEEAGFRRGVAEYDNQKAVSTSKVSSHPIMDLEDALKADRAIQQSGC